MARRRMTLKRIDPWTVLKFGFVANLALLAIWLLGAGIVWFFVRQLELIEKVCEIAGEVGFRECGVNGGNLFRALLLLGLLGTVIQTGLIVFLAFLHNLIADLVGGVSFTYVEEGGTAMGPASRSSATSVQPPTRTPPPPATSPSATGGPPRPAPSAGPSPVGPSPAPGGSSSPGPSGPSASSPSPSSPAAPTSPSGSGPGVPPSPAGPGPGSTSSGGGPSTGTQPGGPPSAPQPGGPPSGPQPGGAPSEGGRQQGSRDPDRDLFGPRGGGAGGSGS